MSSSPTISSAPYHRTGVSVLVANGPDEFVTACRLPGSRSASTYSPSHRSPSGAISSRSGRSAWSSVDGRTVDFLGVYETNADGRFVRGAHYDEGDLDTKLAELDGVVSHR